MSLLFYSWGEPKYIWLFLGTITINWLFVLIGTRLKSLKSRKLIGAITIALNLLILFWFKYAGWIGGFWNLNIGSIVLPIGISFYTFQAISYVADVLLMNKYNAEKNPVNVGLYIAFFPQLIAGPIIRYEDMQYQIRNRRMSIDAFESGCFRFVFGFCKKVLLADSMAVIVNKAWSNVTELTSLFAWLGAIAYTLQIFLDFSAYSDMAIGLGGMFGFTIPENFNNPYKAKSIRDFWRRWHITLSIWFRDYVYIPLGGNKISEKRTIVNMAIVWLLTGFWHGANWTFVIWGIAYGILVITEKLLKIDDKNAGSYKWIGLLYRLFTLLMIVLLWVVFRSDNIGDAMSYIGKMFNFSADGLSQTILYISEFRWAIVISIILCFFSMDKIKEKRTWLWPLMIVLFVVSISYLVKGTFSPFLYFDF